MKRTSIHISIPTPCHESWDGMDTIERGAFCHSCQKEVIDFSAMTDREVIEYLSKNMAGCGRFRKDEVNTNLTIAQIDNGLFKWKALFLGALSFISFRSFSHSADQARIIKAEKQDTVAKGFADSTQQKTVKAESPDTVVKAVAPVILIEQMDTATGVRVDTTIQLNEVEVTETKAPHMVMGDITMVLPREEKTIDLGHRSRFMNIEHPSRRQALKDWFRHFFHLD